MLHFGGTEVEISKIFVVVKIERESAFLLKLPFVDGECSFVDLDSTALNHTANQKPNKNPKMQLT
jgi:hypothetical protein